nr:MAG TPA: hypothetical protein [Caudoviricetes sp.]
MNHLVLFRRSDTKILHFLDVAKSHLLKSVKIILYQISSVLFGGKQNELFTIFFQVISLSSL